MPVVPILMVQYCDESTELRYSDGSKLVLSPCGSVFQHYAPPTQSCHPIQGVGVVQQRCPYATSHYRQKVIEALDFRNRFAVAPYIYKDFYNKEDAVLLHSNIVEVSWPSNIESAEVLEDGSIKLVSLDEFASLILSPHGRDATVCYLSKTSSVSSSSLKPPPKRQHSSPAECRSRHVSGGSNSGVSSKSDGSSRSSKSGKHSKKSSTSRHRLKGGQFGNLAVEPSQNSAFVKVPKRIHSHKRHSSYPKYSDEESSTNSFQSLESVTSSVEDDLCSSYQDLNIQSKCPNVPTSCIKSTVHRSQGQSRRIHQSNGLSLAVSPNISPISRELPSEGPIGFVTEDALLAEEESKHRQYYCWVTQHISCSACPPCWSHPVRLVKEKWERIKSDSITPNTVKPNAHLSKGVSESNPDENKVVSGLPPPVPLVCPGQHLHTWQFSNDLDYPHARGQVKVIMSEGVIYRLVRLPSLRQVEIYPGDCSVIVTQGLSGNFFSHIIPMVGKSQIEEKTYSSKLPPPGLPGERYSLSKLMRKGLEYFNSIHPEHGSVITSHMCWQHQEEITPVDPTPLSSSIKEEHNVMGLGKFLAFHNGKIRIVFADRTALDMMSHDHTPSCHGDHGDSGLSQEDLPPGNVYGFNKAKVWGEAIPEGYCRLLLPNGQYQFVSVQQPGQYKMYIDYAKEWISWTRTPFNERDKFYSSMSSCPPPSTSINQELKKINCFNYVVENTVMKQKNLCMATCPSDFNNFVSRDGLSHSSRDGVSHSSRDGLSHSSRDGVSHSSRDGLSQSSREGVSHSSRDGLSYSSRDGVSHSSRDGRSHSSRDGLSNSANSSFTTSNHVTDSIQSFDDVRRALQKTSQVIHDIDSLLSRRK